MCVTRRIVMAASGVSVSEMDLSFLPRLDPTSNNYRERFATYIDNADQNEKVFEWIADSFDEEIISQLLTIEHEDGNATLSVLGIGSGNGIVEVNMLKQLRKKFHLIECTVVEPSGEQINSYKKLVEEQKDALSGVTFDWRQETIQEFCKANADGSKKFQLISAIHSCYFIAKQDLDFYLNTLCEWTKGKILIMIDAETGGFNRLEKKFFGSTHPSKMLPRENSIRESFQSLGVSFETKVIPGECDITSCFESDSRVGKLLLDFLLQRVGCRDDGPPELLKVIKEFLKTEGISHNRNGRIYAAVPTLVIVASTSYGA